MNRSKKNYSPLKEIKEETNKIIRSVNYKGSKPVSPFKLNNF